MNRRLSPPPDQPMMMSIRMIGQSASRSAKPNTRPRLCGRIRHTQLHSPVPFGGPSMAKSPSKRRPRSTATPTETEPQETQQAEAATAVEAPPAPKAEKPERAERPEPQPEPE